MRDQRPRTIRLLLVDDSEADRFAIRRVLRRHDGAIHVSEAATLAEAVELLDHEGFDCILTDMRLPDGDGLTLLDRAGVGGETAPLPVIAMTGLGDDERAAAALRRGAQDYLVKGEAPDELIVRSIRHAVERHKVRLLEQENRRLRKLSTRDPLTNVLNRMGLAEVLDALRGSTNDGDHEVFALLVDLDDFKQVNDELGHVVGDDVLCETARCILRAVRNTDHVARVGGDEFLVLVPRARHTEVLELGRRVRDAVGDAFVDLGCTVTVSIGIGVVGPTDGVTEILGATGSSLRQSKRRGKNQVSCEAPRHEAETEGLARRPSAQVIAALQRGSSFEVEARPIFGLGNRGLVATELVAVDQSGSFPTDVELFRFCEREGMAEEVDLRRLALCSAGADDLPKRHTVHLRLFPATIVGRTFDAVDDQIRSLSAERGVVVHVSHELIVGEPLSLRERLRRLRTHGICVAIDDVNVRGTDFNTLLLLDPEYVRIGGDWFAELRGTTWKLRVLERFVRAMRTLGAEIIASEIHADEDAELLGRLRVRWGQGSLTLAADPSGDPTSSNSPAPWKEIDTLDTL